MCAKVFGIDFGTSNSAIAVAREGRVDLARFDVPESLVDRAGRETSDTMPTVLFAPSWEREMFIGHRAIAQYLFTGLEGRFVQSMKAFLPQASFSGTMMRGRNYTIEDLVAEFLSRMLREAERALGEKIEGRIVLGRPARFSLEAEEDALAETRLLAGAERAGLRNVALLIEPIAAALAYEARLERDETVLVIDLGGGTSDFTLMRVGPSHRERTDRKDSVLASGGIPIAGDCLDGEIVRARLFEPLGFGSKYRVMNEETPVPHWIWQKLKRWNHVSFLKNKKYLDFLREVLETTDHREEIGTLIQLVDDDMGYLLFRAVERAKRNVAVEPRTKIADEENGLPVSATMTRKQFAEATRAQVEAIEKTAREVLAAANMRADDVDAVFMTGGTSLVPEVRAAFAKVFGETRLRSERTFTSVVDGLARGAAFART
jgi:hypothetical chaperone protein